MILTGYCKALEKYQVSRTQCVVGLLQDSRIRRAREDTLGR